MLCSVKKALHSYQKLHKPFSIAKHLELIVRYNDGLKTLLQQGILEPVSNDDLVHKFKSIIGKPFFPGNFKKDITFEVSEL